MLFFPITLQAKPGFRRRRRPSIAGCILDWLASDPDAGALMRNLTGPSSGTIFIMRIRSDDADFKAMIEQVFIWGMAHINEIRVSTNHSGLKSRCHGAPDIAVLSLFQEERYPPAPFTAMKVQPDSSRIPGSKRW